MKKSPFAGLIALLLLVGACNSPAPEQVEKTVPQPPDYANAIMYEVNIRQYTPEGTFAAFQEHLPRLQELGVDILWLMPIHPIGELNRKGGLGSYYSVKDYKGVNPEFGSLEDFKALVREAQSRGMLVILDWVANHSAWDNAWVSTNPDFYHKDEAGEMHSPYDWTDVVAFDYENPVLHDSMIAAMKYWVEEAGIDGYRCDVAGMVPVDFWEKARRELDAIKPVFMLAEDEQVAALLDKAFDVNYAWNLHFLLDRIAKGEEKADALPGYFHWNDSLYPAHKQRLTFVSNHDENSWKGYLEERLGPAARAVTVFSWTVPGMPLIYSGEEAGLNKRLRFFEKDTISWADTSLLPFYRKLSELRTQHPAVWGGLHGGPLNIIDTGNDPDVFAFQREKDGSKILAFFNFSGEIKDIQWEEAVFSGEEKEWFSGESAVEGMQQLRLDPWGYAVYVH